MRWLAWSYTGLVTLLLLAAVALMWVVPDTVGDDVRYGAFAAGFLAWVALAALGIPGSLLLPALLPDVRSPEVDLLVTALACALNAAVLFLTINRLEARHRDRVAPGARRSD